MALLAIFDLPSPGAETWVDLKDALFGDDRPHLADVVRTRADVDAELLAHPGERAAIAPISEAEDHWLLVGEWSQALRPSLAGADHLAADQVKAVAQFVRESERALVSAEISSVLTIVSVGWVGLASGLAVTGAVAWPHLLAVSLVIAGLWWTHRVASTTRYAR